MIRKRTIATLAALGGMTAAVALLSAPPAAQADELADLRANQELLQRRIDQLAQAPAPAGPGAPTLAGSFPRSFLIPGTDTSLRVGGFGIGRVTWYLRGVQPSADLFGQGNANPDRTEGSGGTGNLPGVPLNSGAAAGPAASHSKSAAFFISGKSTRLFVDARTPTAWGQAQAYVEFDFNTSNNNVLLNGQFTVVPNNPARFRQGYAALGPVLLGTATGSFVDNDSDMELIDDGGQVGSTGRSRIPQLRYTWATPWPGITAIMALEQSDSEFESPNGSFVSSYTSAVTTASCGNGAALGASALTTTTGNPINVACAPLAALFDAAQAREPAGTFNVRIDQPWGHLRLGAVIRDSVLNDGRIDKTWIGYGGAISGDVKPFPGWSPKDDIGFSVGIGEGLGGYIPNSRAVGTNWGGVIGGQNPTIFNGMTFGGCTTCSFNTTSAAGLAARAAYDAGVRGSTITAFNAKLGYVHWWTPELRTNMDFSMVHQDVPNVVNTPGIVGSGGINKELSMAHINLLWSPVAFVTTGVEYAWGHRVVKSNAKGDSHVVQGMLRVNF
jgi:hypothetical protein